MVLQATAAPASLPVIAFLEFGVKYKLSFCCDTLCARISCCTHPPAQQYT
jgi:hypothetical protein